MWGRVAGMARIPGRCWNLIWICHVDPDHPAAEGRSGPHYETDLANAEWAAVAPLMPKPAPCGRAPVWTTQEILNAIFHVLRGCIA